MLLIVWIVLLVTGLVLAVLLARLLVRDSIHVHPRRTGRVLAVVFLGAAFGIAVHFDYAHRRTGGRQAFLESQAQRFDSSISKPHSMPGEMIFGVLYVLAVAGAYELVSWGLYLAIRRPIKNGAA